MSEGTWSQIYYGDLQNLYGLLVVPIAFLAWRAVASVEDTCGVSPAAARFVRGLTLFFAIETMIDPIATGPLSKLEFLRASFLGTLIPFIFVLLGDLRVLLLAIGVARPERSLRRNLAWALAASSIVPIFAGSGFTLARWLVPDLHGQTLWMFYEFGFFALCVALGRLWVSRSVQNDPAVAAFLRAIFGYSAAYYALWWMADVLIVIANLDLGWAIRMIPNQLYYAFWVPFAYWQFYSERPRNAS